MGGYFYSAVGPVLNVSLCSIAVYMVERAGEEYLGKTMVYRFLQKREKDRLLSFALAPTFLLR